MYVLGRTIYLSLKKIQTRSWFWSKRGSNPDESGYVIMSQRHNYSATQAENIVNRAAPLTRQNIFILFITCIICFVLSDFHIVYRML